MYIYPYIYPKFFLIAAKKRCATMALRKQSSWQRHKKRLSILSSVSTTTLKALRRHFALKKWIVGLLCFVLFCSVLFCFVLSCFVLFVCLFVCLLACLLVCLFVCRRHCCEEGFDLNIRVPKTSRSFDKKCHFF